MGAPNLSRKRLWDSAASKTRLQGKREWACGHDYCRLLKWGPHSACRCPVAPLGRGIHSSIADGVPGTVSCRPHKGDAHRRFEAVAQCAQHGSTAYQASTWARTLECRCSARAQLAPCKYHLHYNFQIIFNSLRLHSCMHAVSMHGRELHGVQISSTRSDDRVSNVGTVSK